MVERAIYFHHGRNVEKMNISIFIEKYVFAHSKRAVDVHLNINVGNTSNRGL